MDRWLIVTADGELELNATFHAVNLLPGGVDTNALWRQPGQRAYQRSGDGLLTPGPFILRGNVWRDDGDRDALRTHLQALTEAATTAATVVRLTPSAEYWYGALGGGPNPAITPDGLGGYQVELEFWPARPEPVTVPPSQFRTRVSQRVPSSTYFAEVFTAPGPVVLNNPGGTIADLLGRNWALIVDRAAGIVRLSGEGSDGEWIDTPVPGHPVIGSPTPSGARRFSLAFDQAANPVVAFEHAGAVRVTRWDASLGQYVQNVSFAGVDPVLALDASWALAVPDSDVLLFYLSSDRERVMARIQRDNYGTEYGLHDYGAPVILDRVAALPYQYQLLVSDAAGAALPGLLSGLYPIALPSDALVVAAAGPNTAAYVDTVLAPHLPEDALTALGVGAAAGTYGPAIVEAALPSDALVVAAAGPNSAEYASAIINIALEHDDLDATGTGASSATYQLVVINHNLAPDELSASGIGPTEGTYAAV